MKRQRGRGRKPGGGHHHNHQQHHPNRALESNGPDTKVRGPAAHIYERYLQLARDAASSGDRVLSENYMQHADHYFRLVRQMQPAAPPPPPERFGGEQDYEGEDDGAPETEGAEEGDAVAAEGGDQPDVEFPAGEQPRFERGEGEGRRRRGRRNRFRPGEGGEGGGGEGDERRAEGGEPREPRRERAEGEGRREPRAEGEGRREPRAEGESRRDRPPRERNGDREQAGPEGFSSGPKPAFLRGD